MRQNSSNTCGATLASLVGLIAHTVVRGEIETNNKWKSKVTFAKLLVFEGLSLWSGSRFPPESAQRRRTLVNVLRV